MLVPFVHFLTYIPRNLSHPLILYCLLNAILSALLDLGLNALITTPLLLFLKRMLAFALKATYTIYILVFYPWLQIIPVAPFPN